MSSAPKLDDAFEKPYFETIYRTPAVKRRHPYPRALFREREIFPLLLLDSGAFFWVNDRLGGKADGRAILDGIESGALLAPWLRDGKLDWELPLRRHAGSSIRTPLEERVWIHRLYFLLPLAQEFFRTGEKKWARKWISYFRQWAESHPRTSNRRDGHPSAAAGGKKAGARAAGTRPAGTRLVDDFAWFDMQVCWRLLVLIHSIYLLKGSRLARGDWGLIYAAVKEHAAHALEEAKSEISQGTQGANHSLQRGTALLYAGILFPELDAAETCVEAGRTILTWQMREQVLADGGSVEGSPSYSHFIARYYAEAWALMHKNRVKPLEGLETTIRRQYEWLFQASSPAGLCLQIGDSYALDARADIQTARRLFPVKLPKSRTSVHFRESGFAVLRNARFALYVDAMKLREDHQHVGRPNLLLYADGLPLLVDSGCCNYDWLIQEQYMRGAFAHNVVLVPELQEPMLDVYVHGAQLRERYSEVAITEFAAGERESRISTTATVRQAGGAYTWSRQIIMEQDRVRISDRVVSESAVDCRQLFHVAPTNVALSEDGGTALIRHGGKDVRMEHVEPCRFRIRYHPAVDNRNILSLSPTLVSEARGTECRFEVILKLGQ